MIIDSPGTDISVREKIAMHFLKDKKVEKLSMINSSVLSLFATGRTRGCVVESGHGVSFAVPIFEGQSLPHAIQREEIGGQDVTAFLTEMLNTQPNGLEEKYNGEIAKIKEIMCKVATNFQLEISREDPLEIGRRTQELPDKTSIEVGHVMRLQSAELMFSGKAPTEQLAAFRSEFGRESVLHDFERNSIAKIAMTSVNKCDAEVLNDLLANVVVAGGNTMLKDFPARLQSEMESLLKDSDSAQVEIVPEPQRFHAAWVGGSMLASLDEFAKNITIKRADWEEGKSREQVQKYCFN